MQDPQPPPDSDIRSESTTGQRPDLHLVGDDGAVPHSDASTGPLLPAFPARPGDPNYHGMRRMFGVSLGMFLPAIILLAIGIAVIVYIAW
ncbi:MAG: hypothetical protein QM589_07435 [Thermomicrobiales bacterium]